MSGINMWLLIAYLFILLFNGIESRIVPAETDICNRHPSFAVLCAKPTPADTQAPVNVPKPAVAAQPTPPKSPPTFGEQGTMNKTTYCRSYNAHFVYFCSDSGSIGENVKNFCAQYTATCPEETLGTPAPVANYTDPNIIAMCRQNFQLAVTFCKDKGGEAKSYRDKCDLWRKYCKDNPNLALAATDPQVAQICNSYQSMADAYCPGYETIQLRQYCNYYRYYCQGKKPFPNIDGQIGIVPTSWGVGGIPYYPFNPQGVVAGGQKVDVGFGDWGADVADRRGVLDYWEQANQVDANWQRGTFGGGNSWNVPVVGIGGFNRAGVSLGGIANPSDIPGVLSGGIRSGPPLSGLGQIPLSQNQPVGLSASPASQLVSGLQAPAGTGNLGLLGSVLRQEPIQGGPGMLSNFGSLGGLGGLTGRRRKRRSILPININNLLHWHRAHYYHV